MCYSSYQREEDRVVADGCQGSLKVPKMVFFIKKRVHFIKNSDVINFVIDQSQPGVFYLQKMMNFMKPGVFYLKKMMNFMNPGVFYLQKMMNFMKMRTFYKKLPLFIKNSILHTYKKFKPQI